ncbi:hypothetical protein [Moraxella oculi]|uniref:Uncharacterized protein n=1 Tax=Moraxella oculi TaxID=2940516 RepID=A0ABW8U371_9GAMM
MKFLITIHSDSELIAYEAIALGLTLASFDHLVQFHFTSQSHLVLNDCHSRAHGMIQSLELYDLPKAWANFKEGVSLDDAIVNALTMVKAVQTADFDGVLEF